MLINGTKSMTGHLLGGAGALESFAAVMALLKRQVPGTINVEHLEEGLKSTSSPRRPTYPTVI